MILNKCLVIPKLDLVRSTTISQTNVVKNLFTLSERNLLLLQRVKMYQLTCYW